VYGEEASVVRQVLQADRRILETVGRWHRPTVTLLMRTLTRIGDASSWVFVALVMLAAGGAARHCGLLLAAATAIATVMSQILKRTCRRPRPSSGIGGFIALAENPDAFSFPSGHAAAAFAAAIALAGQGWLGTLYLSLAVAIALSRVYLGAHYPLDVAVGASVGVLAGAFARLLL